MTRKIKILGKFLMTVVSELIHALCTLCKWVDEDETGLAGLILIIPIIALLACFVFPLN